jgi:hypothetical protein
MIKVIGVELPRTGTTSLKAALERLGFDPCHHMQEIGAHSERAATVAADLRRQPGRLGSVLRGYRAAVDWPSAHFWRPLAQATRPWRTYAVTGWRRPFTANLVRDQP